MSTSRLKTKRGRSLDRMVIVEDTINDRNLTEQDILEIIYLAEEADNYIIKLISKVYYTDEKIVKRIINSHQYNVNSTINKRIIESFENVSQNEFYENASNKFNDIIHHFISECNFLNLL
jgi:hypothetical protein